MINQARIQIFLPAILTVLFMGACLTHYFSQRPLWLDEIAVLNIIEKYDYSEFAQEFVPPQSFPRVYLAGVKALGASFENHVLSLRFISLLAMLGAFFVWFKLFYQTFRESETRIMSLLAFTSSFYMMYYAAELKPYSMDVLVIGVFTWFLIKQGQFLPTKEWMIAGVLPLLIFFSYGSLFIFWMVPLNYLLYLRGSRKFLKPFIVSAVSSVVCFTLFAFFDIQHSITNAGVNYWESYFLCIDTASCFWEPFGEGIKRLGIVWWSRTKFFQHAAVPFAVMMLYGAFRYGVAALHTHKGTLTQMSSIGLVLMVELFVLGILKKYPFTGGRLTLFMAPFLMYFIIRGFADFRRVKYAGIAMWIYAHVYFGAVFVYNIVHFIKLYF